MESDFLLPAICMVNFSGNGGIDQMYKYCCQFSFHLFVCSTQYDLSNMSLSPSVYTVELSHSVRLGDIPCMLF